ncbi:hypothetical protein GCM10018793_52820 [Streptomyces sulfonofaciens]|uniref:Uncharacterized protein n=1 Tax=Streptomyces sulfonofaciens TaxID=68272 RepID=A0A919GIC3_9ACTN|nr:hypothetical protein [Streptomyces sulfonofaciens]GHH85327.1 hypothetical protein GCM10018793_52820 [Streptomyces sulfonofaciens]
MGWRHDYSDVASNRRSAATLNALRGGPPDEGHGPSSEAIGIPRILRRRARWVSARLRHTRG